MFARVKRSGLYEYLQIVQNRREGTKTIQRVVATIGRMDQIQQKGEIENLVRSLSRFSEKVLLVLSGKSDVRADARKIGPALICERLWKELEIGKIIRRFLAERKFGFDVERAVFLTVLHRLFVFGCVVFRPTPTYLEGEGGETIGELGHTKDHRPDLHQMVVGVILDDHGQPVCSEMWPGNTTDVTMLVPIIKRLRSRFAIGRICVVSDRGVIGAETVESL